MKKNIEATLMTKKAIDKQITIRALNGKVDWQGDLSVWRQDETETIQVTLHSPIK
jgi:hypothetical protein